MELQATALKGIVRSSDEGLFYLFPIQDVSTLQQAKAHLTCAIDVLSHPEECSPEQRLDAVRTLNSLVAALSVHDDDHYSAGKRKSLPCGKIGQRKVAYGIWCDDLVHHA